MAGSKAHRDAPRKTRWRVQANSVEPKKTRWTSRKNSVEPEKTRWRRRGNSVERSGKLGGAKENSVERPGKRGGAGETSVERPEKLSGGARKTQWEVQGSPARKRWQQNSVGSNPTEFRYHRLRAAVPCTLPSRLFRTPKRLPLFFARGCLTKFSLGGVVGDKIVLAQQNFVTCPPPHRKFSQAVFCRIESA